MANGICDIAGCQRETYMGWRPLSENIGQQVCEYHIDKHRSPDDGFNLFDAFGFQRLPAVQSGYSWQTNSRPALRRCVCGAELPKGYRYCQKCAKEREWMRKREYRQRKKAREIEAPEPDIAEGMFKCRICGQEREYGHSYCDKCAKRQKQKSNRERQRRNRKKKRLKGFLKEG